MKKKILLFCVFNIIIGQTNQINKILISPKRMEYLLIYHRIYHLINLKLQAGTMNPILGII